MVLLLAASFEATLVVNQPIPRPLLEPMFVSIIVSV